jgi:hypothetical protein
MQAVLAWLLGASLLAACGPSQPPREHHQASIMSPSPGEPASTAPAPTGAGARVASVRFGSTHGDRGHDPDGNGLFENLAVDVAVDVMQAGDVTVSSTLSSADGGVLAMGSLDPALDRAAPRMTTTLQAGAHTVAIYFNGFAVRSSGVDGPYTVGIDLIGSKGTTLDTIRFTTSPYRHQAFQGLPAELRALRDERLVANMRRGSAALRLTVTLEVPAASEMTVQGQLFAGSALIADVTHTIAAQAGVRTENLDFPGDAILASGLDGPYSVYLTIAGGPYVVNHEHTTAAYSAADFRAP